MNSSHYCIEGCPQEAYRAAKGILGK